MGDSESLSSEQTPPRLRPAGEPLLEVCLNHRGDGRPSCLASGSQELYKALKAWPDKTCSVKASTCMGGCHRGPVVRLRRAGMVDVYHGEASFESVRRFLLDPNTASS